MTGSGVVQLCVLLWARPGCEADLVVYEDRVLELIPEHGGTVVSRARSDGTDGHPLEVQLYSFPSQPAIDAYLTDARRLALAPERDRVVSRTEMFPVRFS